MGNDQRPADRKDDIATTSVGILSAHLFWIAIGPCALAILLFSIAQAGSGWLTGLDLGLFAVVILTLGARWIDQRSGQSTTVYGEPASWADYRRFAMTLPLVAGVAWVMANVIGNHLWTMGG